MVVFERLFAVYYFMFILKKSLIKKSKFFREFDEDSGALAFLVTGEWLMIALAAAFLKAKFDYTLSSGAAIIGLLVYGLLFFLQNRLFIVNRQRRRKIIEEFRSLPKPRKLLWNIIGIFLIIIPVVMFPLLL